jgi:hypothetical protein
MQYIDFKNLLADLSAAKKDPNSEVYITDAIVSVHEFDNNREVIFDGGFVINREEFTPLQWAKVQAVR